MDTSERLDEPIDTSEADKEKLDVERLPSKIRSGDLEPLNRQNHPYLTLFVARTYSLFGCTGTAGVQASRLQVDSALRIEHACATPAHPRDPHCIPSTLHMRASHLPSLLRGCRSLCLSHLHWARPWPSSGVSRRTSGVVEAADRRGWAQWV
eukprot:5820544-Prymnesium_polylepis.1